MDKAEARSILQERLTALRKCPYQGLTALLSDERIEEVVGPSGASYTVATQALWDDRGLGHLRVMVAIDDGGWRAFAPLTSDFIVSPDGSFIGE